MGGYWGSLAIWLSNVAIEPFSFCQALGHQGLNRQFAHLGGHRGLSALQMPRDGRGALPSSIDGLLRLPLLLRAHFGSLILALEAKELVYVLLVDFLAILSILAPSLWGTRLPGLMLPGLLLVHQVLGNRFDVAASNTRTTSLRADLHVLDARQVHTFDSSIVFPMDRQSSLPSAHPR